MSTFRSASLTLSANCPQSSSARRWNSNSDPTIDCQEPQEKIPPWTLELSVNGQQDNWEIYSGAVVTICGEDLYRKFLNPTTPLRQGNISLEGWGGKKIKLLGVCEVTVRLGEITRTLPLHVAKGWGTPLIGRNWFAALGLKLVLGRSPDIAKVAARVRDLPRVEDYPRHFECFKPKDFIRDNQ